MAHLGYMTAAYTILWVALMLYVLHLHKRQKAIWEELHNLRASLRRGETESP